MDYSLLLQMEKIEPDQTVAQPRNIWMSNDARHVFHISIIDYLQAWGFTKRNEVRFKRIFRGEDPKLLSAARPDYYQERFLQFMKNVVFLP